MRRVDLLAVLAVAVGLAGCGGGGVTTTGTGASRPPAGSGSTPSHPRASGSAAAGQGNARQRPPFGMTPVNSVELVLTRIAQSRQLPASALCGVLTTPTYVKRAYGSDFACTESIRRTGARSMRIASVSREGDRAVVAAIPQGGPNDGERLKVSLIRQAVSGYRAWGALWRVVSVRSNAKVGP